MYEVAGVTRALQLAQRAADCIHLLYTRSAAGDAVAATRVKSSSSALRVSIFGMSTLSLRYALLTLLIAAGCSSNGGTDGGLRDGAMVDGGGDASASCGNTTCTADQLCVSRQDCGTVACTAVPASGVCPSGTSATASCPGTGTAGCLGGCTPTFSCQARPAGCTPTLSCACVSTLCAPDTCLAAMDDRVACAAQ
jgi:hypothetical protein